MLHATIVMEDNLVIATREDDGFWHLHISDLPTGKVATIKVNDDKMGAIMALMFAGDTLSDSTSAELYKVIDTTFDGLHNELRLIP